MPKTKNTNPSPDVETEIVDIVYDIDTTYKNKDDSINQIKIASIIPYPYLVALIQMIVDGVVDANGYYPYYYNSSLYGYIIQFYTDLGNSIGLDEAHELVYKTDIKDVLHREIADYQLGIIFESVDKLIEFKKQQLTNKSEMDGLFKDLRALLGKFSDGFDSETMTKAMGNLASMTNVNEGNVINALVDNLKSGKSKAVKTGKKDKKANVTVLPPVGQIDFNGEILEE